MGKFIAAITTSVDGYIVGPMDGPEHGLGIGGERLHYWVARGRTPTTATTPTACTAGFEQDIDLEVLGTWSSQYATHVRYAVKRAGQELAAH